jgi:CelD/BcsL family acetyltransferase involved in cellulose biosynthesis
MSWLHFDADSSHPQVITVREGGELIGLAPLRLRRRRYGLVWECVLESLGMSQGDRLSFLARPDREAIVWDEVLGVIEHLNWSQWCLPEIDVASVGYRKLCERFGPDSGFTRSVEESGEALLTDISGTWEDFHGSHKRMRRNLRALDKALPDHRFERYVTPDTISEGVALAEELAAKTWKRGKVGLLKSDETRDFYRRLLPTLATDGFTGVRLIRNGDEIVASQIGLLCGDRVHFHSTDYNPAYESLSPGMMMVALTIKDFFDSPATTVDYLTGYAGYMQSWATDKVTTEQLTIARRPGRLSIKGPYRRLNARLAHS